jgi:hypothetical protein
LAPEGDYQIRISRDFPSQFQIHHCGER